MKKTLILFLVSVLFFIKLNAKDTEQYILPILKLCPETILDVHNEKYYINNESLTLTEKGIILLENNIVIPIKQLYVDEKGYYLKNNSFKDKTNKENFEIWQCNVCDTIFSPDISNGYKCPNCGFRDATKPLHY